MGLFDSIGNVAKGALGFTPLGAVVDSTMNQSKNMPTYQAPQLDSQTQNLINQREGLANRSAEDIANERTQGTNKSADLAAIQGGYGLANSNLLMNQPENVREALNRRANKGYAQSLSKIQNQARLDAVQEKQNARQQVLQAKFQQAQANANIMHQRDMEEFNNRAARNNALSSLLGTGGMIAGTLLGGPMGGAAGSKLGGEQKSYMTGGNSYQDTSGMA